MSSHDRPVQRGPSTSPAELRGLYDLYMGRGRASLRSIDLSHVSPFRRKVYSLLYQIPRSRVTTYGAIAEKTGSRRYARAVGAAVGSNPMPLLIPCHRVVLSSLRVGSYGIPSRRPFEGSQMKRQLLEREGVRFLKNKISDECLWFPN
jgi:methylated-DNA-[protein]-cysteine S-methyltransferase